MEFHKKRDFGELITDTFQFFKENGRNYFKNYLLLNGLMLILLMVIIVFGYREILSQIFSSNADGQSYFFQQYFQENTAVLIIAAVFIFFLFLAISVINYSYPVFYLKRLIETGSKKINADDILSDIKQNGKRLFILFLGMFFIIFPVTMLIMGISYILIFVLIGLVILLFVGPSIFNTINFLLFDYLNTNKGFFESLSYALRAQFSYRQQREKTPYWKYWGSTLVMYIILQVITSVFTMITLIIMMFSLITSAKDLDNTNPMDSLGIFFFVTYGIAILVSLVLSNIIYINSGLQYYDSRTDLHQNKSFQEIDSIGKNEI